MPTIWIPTPLRDLTQGKSTATVTGSTVREAIESLEVQFPGIKERLCDGEKIRANISVFVDGQSSHLKLRERLVEASEVHFLFTISGGCTQRIDRIVVDHQIRQATPAYSFGNSGQKASQNTRSKGINLGNFHDIHLTPFSVIINLIMYNKLALKYFIFHDLLLEDTCNSTSSSSAAFSSLGLSSF